MSYFLKIEVEIKTTKGTYYRTSDAAAFSDAAAADVSLFSGVLSYPDIRATKFRLYSSSDNSTYLLCKTTAGASAVFDALRPAAGNFVYSVIPNIDLTDQGTGTPNATTGTDRDPNRIAFTGAAQPHYVSPSTIYTPRGDGNPVMRFEANTRPVSPGQYGVAPVIVLSRYSVDLLQVDSNAEFYALAPIAERGCVGRYASCNAEGLVFFASDDGIWTLSPMIGSKAVSSPVHAFETSDDILDDLSSNTVMAYHDDGRGHRTVFVGNDGTASVGVNGPTWCYATDYNMWYTLPRKRTVYHVSGTKLISVDDDTGFLTEETREVDTGLLTPAGVKFYLKSATIKSGAPGFMRRLYRFAVRQRGSVDQVNYVIFNPYVEGEEVNQDYTVSSAEDAYSLYTDTLAINDTLTASGDVSIAQATDGAVVTSGVLIDGDARSNASGMCHDWYFVLTGSGKPGQGLESVDFEYELRYDHRLRRRAVYSTMPLPSTTVTITAPISVSSTGAHDSITITWGEVTGARYRVWWGTDPSSLTNVIDTGEETATITYEGDGTVIYFQIEAYS